MYSTKLNDFAHAMSRDVIRGKSGRKTQKHCCNALCEKKNVTGEKGQNSFVFATSHVHVVSSERIYTPEGCCDSVRKQKRRIMTGVSCTRHITQQK